MSDAELDYMETFIPLLARDAFEKARFDTLSAGCSVLEVINDAIYEVFADGTKKKIKNVPPCIEVDSDTKIELNCNYGTFAIITSKAGTYASDKNLKMTLDTKGIQ